MRLKITDREIYIENATIGWRNFEGVAKRYNKEGDRNFTVFFDDEDAAKQLFDLGWNVKWPKPNDRIAPEEDDRQPSLEVAVAFGPYPPKCLMIVGDNPTALDENTIKELDTAELENVDLVIRPYNWKTADGSGIKAYLKTIYATLRSDEFTNKYGY